MSARCNPFLFLLRICGADGGGVGVLQAGALFAGLLMVDSPYAKKAHACMQPLTSLFGGMYLGSLGMIVNPVRESFRRVDDTPNLPRVWPLPLAPGVILFGMLPRTADDYGSRRP